MSNKYRFLDDGIKHNDVQVSLIVVAYKIDDWALKKTTRWSIIIICGISMMLWLFLSQNEYYYLKRL